MNNKFFKSVYPFTTEEIAGYFPLLELEGKKVFTVGSSSDQAFNALLLGAKDITVYDINEDTARFGKIKRDIIINCPSRRKMYNKVLKEKDILLSKDLFSYESLTKMNPYMSSSNEYKKLRKLLIEEQDKIRYVQGDIMNLEPIKDEKYDVIITSNVLQYLDFFIPKDASPDVALQILFSELKDHLTEDGILQLLYYYTFTNDYLKSKSNYYSTACLPKVVKALNKDTLYLETFNNSYGRKDAIITYVKK